MFSWLSRHRLSNSSPRRKAGSVEKPDRPWAHDRNRLEAARHSHLSITLPRSDRNQTFGLQSWNVSRATLGPSRSNRRQTAGERGRARAGGEAGAAAGVAAGLLGVEIAAIHWASKRTYGSPRVHQSCGRAGAFAAARRSVSRDCTWLCRWIWPRGAGSAGRCGPRSIESSCSPPCTKP